MRAPGWSVARPGVPGRARASVRWWALPAAILGLLGGCALLHPKPGDGCRERDAICQGSAGAIVCRAGHYEKTACGGPAGCATASDRTVRCDQSRGAAEGTVCLAEYEGRAHCDDERTARLRCEGGTWRRDACPEGASCQASDLGVACVPRLMD